VIREPNGIHADDPMFIVSFPIHIPVAFVDQVHRDTVYVSHLVPPSPGSELRRGTVSDDCVLSSW